MKKTNSPQFSLRALILSGLLSATIALVLVAVILFSVVGVDGASLIRAQKIIQSRFVGEYTTETMTDGALRGMVDALGDRWSYYLTAEEYARVRDARNNSYVGIGVTVSCEKGKGLLILSVEDGSPADQAGLQAGEVIVAVGGVPIWQEAEQDCVEKIKGEEGTMLSLELEGEDGARRTVELRRETVKTVPVRGTMLDNQVGFVKILNFYSGTAVAFEQTVKQLIGEGAQALVFDVRNNPGGYVTELTDMLDFLLPSGTIFMSQDIDGKETVYTSEDSSVSVPIAVLVNADSYSAAEFFAAELRESVDAALVGEQTSGKGYAQQLFDLPNGGAMGISTSKYYTGEGVSLIGTGVKPEPLVPINKEQSLQLQRGTLQEDPQLQAALNVLGYGK